jgi:hypothetical protein
MKKVSGFMAILCLAFALSGCATSPPDSFSRSVPPAWSNIELREGLDYDRAWNTVFALLSRHFDMTTVLKGDGYIQTGWLHTWPGEHLDSYKVRVTVRFSPDRRTLQLRTEAWWEDDDRWIVGTDSRLQSTLKTDLMGLIGRTTR